MSELQSNSELKSELRIDEFFTPASIANDRFRGWTAVVIDVLRTTTSITMALYNGARDVIPVESVSKAIDLSIELKREDILLCGEREGKLIEGFHLGNSPSDYTRERVRGRTLIFGSTNGSPAINRASSAKYLFLCGFINLNSIVDALMKLPDLFPLAIICAGKLERFAIEDAVCGGLLIDRLLKRLKTKPVLNDAAQVSLLLNRVLNKDIHDLLRESDHGRYLMSIGMESDLVVCASDSSLSITPALKDGRIVKL